MVKYHHRATSIVCTFTAGLLMSENGSRNDAQIAIKLKYFIPIGVWSVNRKYSSCKNNDVDAVRVLLTYGADANL